MISMGRFVVRTILAGRVDIGKRVFAPQNNYLPYDGRLDGMRYAFGLYRHYGGDISMPAFAWGGVDYADRVESYGTEEFYRCTNEVRSRELFESDPQVVDGRYNWHIWRMVEEKE